MRLRVIGRALLAAAGILAAPLSGPAQDFLPRLGDSDIPTSVLDEDAPPPEPEPRYIARGQEGGGFQVPGNTFPTLPIPTGGGPGHTAGFYGAVEFVFLTQTRAIGDQTVAYHGLVDSSGRITGLPGTYIGSRQPALTTDKMGKTNFFPGYNIEIGYKFDDGTRIYGSFMQLFEANYNDGASLATQYARSNRSLTDTFLTAGVFNFNPQFSGPARKTGFDLGPNNPGHNTYGIWNGASTMDLKFSQRFTFAEIGARTPLFQTEYSRTYGLAGGRYAWFFERFTWRTAAFDINGVGGPQNAASYTNTLSQRLYGPFFGCGQEVFLCNVLSASLDLTGSPLVGVVKQRSKYELDTELTQSKRGWNDFIVVPNFNGNFNLWWYPTEGVQLRVGYQAQTYYATKYMREAIGFNFAAPDPAIDTKWFRVIHGFNVGLGLFF